MKKLEIIIRPERLDDLKTILNSCNAHGLMITNIMGYGSQKGHKQAYNGVDFGGNLLPKVKVETIVDDDTAEKIIDLVIEFQRCTSFHKMCTFFETKVISKMEVLKYAKKHQKYFSKNTCCYSCGFHGRGFCTKCRCRKETCA